MNPPRFAASLSTRESAPEAEQEALDVLIQGLGGAAPDLLVAFATPHVGSAVWELGPRLAEATGARHLVGCVAAGVLAGPREAEGSPGLALWAAKLPGTAVESFETGAVPGPEDGVLFTGRPQVGDPAQSSVLLFADPFQFPTEAFLQDLETAHPGLVVVGGLASGASGPGQPTLFTADGLSRSGAVGAVLSGDFGIQPLVSQGCRPVGRPFVITAAKENRIQRLGGKPAVDVLMETLGELPPEERFLLQRAPFVGLAVDPTKSEFHRDDFLVRGLMGIHPKEAALAVADLVRRGQTIQFLVRDAASASEDLRAVLQRLPPSPTARGALLFTCNGRGRRMFAAPNHDASAVASALGPGSALAGFFAAGEIGPVGGHNFLHGFTASVAVFSSRI